MSPSSPDAGYRGPLFDPVFGADELGVALSDRAWIGALLDVEVALTRAAAALGRVENTHADAVATAATSLAEELDPADLGRRSAAGGNGVIPLVSLLRERADAPARAVHVGATSQDVLDTALMLLARRAGGIALANLRSAADGAARLAAAHRETPMVARTLGQQALPTTFGALAAGWLLSLDDAATELDRILSALPAQYGGAAGTLAAVHPDGFAFADTVADLLGLARPVAPWHTARTPVTTLAGTLGVAAGAVAKPATDVVLMASTEFGEVSEDAPGGSSAMPHKRNPVAAITARAAARRVPGLVSTILSSTDHEFQRAAGAWHAEWETLADILRLTGGAAHQLSTSLNGLHVHTDALDRNLALTGGAILAEKVTAALAEHTDDARSIVTDAAVAGRSLDEDPAITAHLDPQDVRELLDPTRYLGHAADIVDRVLARHDSTNRTTGDAR
ncbi:3-carboxy-cis,cis-muconate cycloisomerase [Rhodococcus rhodochrous]|uniref:3-carboxy-cis,cis-muconate cycloisomerase n=1 Tax=Rhodococcus rhodochrous TaxID=1829 RepID=UPI001E4D55D5|nr:3-carboxy-cis,cis-muconate cycloisomerase [Rhodococcus rhodochrous]MCD2097457.1 3-carboxy-cis,cis-muconate cycloisomerase [Rhodococcus rhodochrous]MCD2122627.1 3-carboxy-cis,cis-muconate cycloisomerase [Rhodococcus rhodochrous]MCQ4133569.1 3-carboxy-cis,cis-muconate cycloisomerase [Rhodococcus rhodochrous]MDJ0018073.1 3-carboxy-cis,cis-muconate cycloisomerase [Rhodococcus rhodochrous]